MPTTPVPAVDGWFTIDDEPRLLGTRCTSCGTVFFPRASGFCRNPDCRGREFDEVRLSRTGTVWSYTDAQYQPPPPYIPADGYGVDDLSVGATVELVVETLYELEGVPHLMYRWKPIAEVAQ
jgi:hypothetical protein